MGTLFSGGKDSYIAMQMAADSHEISCLLTINSHNQDSWMFHTPAITWTKLQAESLGIPQVVQETEGIQDKELDDLFELIKNAKNKYSIQGIVTGALASTYQSTRIQKICNELDLWCFNPLWQLSQEKLLEKLQTYNIISIITGVAAEPFDESWLGKELDSSTIDELLIYSKKYRINPAGEGGEFESLVINAPMFTKKLDIISSQIHYSNFSGRLEIKEAKLE
ncbi:MAG: diphthine--ammonia ligase [Candidatus Thermoplasmatota archaeon]|nr:diphthine--ammonia ligase [Candidatus Thermoplasmatota archaeon]